MKLTVDIIGDFIGLLTLTGAVNSFSNDGTNTTLNVDKTFHVRARMFITVEGNPYEVLSVNVDSQIVVIGVIANPILFAVAPPFYFHGTPIAANQETNGLDSVDKLPMIYLAEVLKEKDLDENSAIARESEIRLFFLDTANFEDWKTDDYYSNRLSGLNSLIDQFILSYKKFKLFESSDTVFSRVNFAKWGVFSNNKGTLTNIFDDHLTGVELSFTLKLRKCDLKTPLSVCSAKTFDELVNILGRGYNYPQPTGQTTVFRTGDDADIENTIFAPIRAANDLKAKNSIKPDFITLNNNNVFGNTNRFTDSEGLQDYGATGSALVDYIIDHYTGLAWNRIDQAAAQWNNAIDNSFNSVANGLSGWFLPNTNMMQSISNWLTSPRNYSPFSSTIGNKHSSTTNPSNSINNLYVTTSQRVFSVSKTTSWSFYICRKHF